MSKSYVVFLYAINCKLMRSLTRLIAAIKSMQDPVPHTRNQRFLKITFSFEICPCCPITSGFLLGRNSYQVITFFNIKIMVHSHLLKGKAILP